MFACLIIVVLVILLRWDGRCGGLLDWDAAGGRRAAFLAPVWGVGVVCGAGRRGSVACGVAQRALLSAFMFVFMSFLYFRSHFSFFCICVLVCYRMA